MPAPPLPLPLHRNSMSGISDSDAKELKRKVEELEAEKEARTEDRIVRLESGFSELSRNFGEFRAELKAMFRSYAVAIGAFWAIIVAAGALALRWSMGH